MAAHTKKSAPKRKSRASGGLTRWFKEDWRDVKTGKKCGRGKNEKGKNERIPEIFSIETA